MYNGIGLQTARGSGTNGYVQTNKFFVRPRNGGKPVNGGKGFEDDQGTAGLSKKPNKAILEHDRKRQIHLKLAILEDKLADQGYSDAEIAQKLEEARLSLEAAANEESDGAGDSKISDTQTHQVAARKEKQMEALKGEADRIYIFNSKSLADGSVTTIPMKDEDMEARIEQKKKISEIFKDFMTGITQLEELGNAANNFLLRFQQGLSFLQRPPMVTSSKLMENIIKKNETRRLKSYMEAGCINIHDAAQSTRALHTSLSGLSDHLIKAKSLLIDLEHLTDEAALAIESATLLDKDSSNELRQVTCDEENGTAQLPQGPEVTEYAALIAVIYSMMKQNYAMQEKIVRSLSLKSSSGELESYSLMWSLRPFVEDEILNRAWKWIY